MPEEFTPYDLDNFMQELHVSIAELEHEYRDVKYNKPEIRVDPCGFEGRHLVVETNRDGLPLLQYWMRDYPRPSVLNRTGEVVLMCWGANLFSGKLETKFAKRFYQKAANEIRATDSEREKTEEPSDTYKVESSMRDLIWRRHRIRDMSLSVVFRGKEEPRVRVACRSGKDFYHICRVTNKLPEAKAAARMAGSTKAALPYFLEWDAVELTQFFQTDSGQPETEEPSEERRVGMVEALGEPYGDPRIDPDKERRAMDIEAKLRHPFDLYSDRAYPEFYDLPPGATPITDAGGNLEGYALGAKVHWISDLVPVRGNKYEPVPNAVNVSYIEEEETGPGIVEQVPHVVPAHIPAIPLYDFTVARADEIASEDSGFSVDPEPSEPGDMRIPEPQNEVERVLAARPSARTLLDLSGELWNGWNAMDHATQDHLDEFRHSLHNLQRMLKVRDYEDQQGACRDMTQAEIDQIVSLSKP